MAGLSDGRVVVVTGAARGLGRAHALELARQGASVVVNDLGVGLDGETPSSEAAEAVAEEIRAAGGDAVANADDVSDWEGARRIVTSTVERFGRIDALVNNAGILRDRMIFNMEPEDWDAVMRVHLRGTFAPTRWAAVHWRERSKAGERVDARIVNVTSPSGLYGNAGQSNYAAAKAGIASFTITVAKELERYGVMVNAVSPAARTRMTDGLLEAVEPDGGIDPWSPDHVAPVVAWLCSADSAGITGQVLEAEQGRISLAEGWRSGPTRRREDRLWQTAEMGPLVREFIVERDKK
jgi:NAD(P)-dependent dehydrogenase (short-subunit alcohol dehydrogenase family)